MSLPPREGVLGKKKKQVRKGRVAGVAFGIYFKCFGARSFVFHLFFKKKKKKKKKKQEVTA
jgi:phage-related protein